MPDATGTADGGDPAAGRDAAAGRDGLPPPAVVTPPPPAVVPPPAAPPVPLVPSSLPVCSDGVDNDGDGTIDRNDPGCFVNDVYVPTKASEVEAAALAHCARGQLRLTDVFGRNGRTVLRGVAGPQSVGATVAIYDTRGKRVATARVRPDLYVRHDRAAADEGDPVHQPRALRSASRGRSDRCG